MGRNECEGGGPAPVVTKSRSVPLLEQANPETQPMISGRKRQQGCSRDHTATGTSGLEANQKIHVMLERGTTVEQDLHDGWGLQGRDVKLIDYGAVENNTFTVIRQYPVKHHKEPIPDIVLFVNGMPVAVIECKSPYLDKAMQEAFRQLNRYQENGSEFKNRGCPQLSYGQIIVGTHRDVAWFGTNYTTWRTS